MKICRFFVALVIAAHLGGLPFGPTARCLAQEKFPGPNATSPGDVVRLEERLQAVETRLRLLEDRMNELLAERPSKDERNAGAQSSAAKSSTASAADPQKTTIEDRFEALDQKVRVIERRRELEQESAAEKAKETPTVAIGKDGFSVSSADKNFQVKVAGYFQADSRFFINDASPVAESFQLGRARPIIQGTVFKYFDFRIMPDFAGGQTVLQDMNLDFTYFPMAKIRAGKFKAPFGIERLMSATDLLFVARAFPTLLVPNRDLGVQVSGDPLRGALSYAVGAFNGVVDGASGDLDTNDAKDVVARVFAQPFRNGTVEPLKGFGFGLAASDGKQLGALPSFKTSSGASFFSYSSNVTADGIRYRFSPQAYYYVGPVGLLTEYVGTSQQVKKGSSVAAIQNHAWQVAGSYVLSGGKPSNRGVTPPKSFNPKEGALGAFEVAGRYAELNIDGEAFRSGLADITKSARQAKAWAVGFNWYLTKMVRVMIDYEQTCFTGGSLLGNRASEHAVLSRFQIGF